MALEALLAFTLRTAEAVPIPPLASLSDPIFLPKTKRQSNVPNSCCGKDKRGEEERRGEKGKWERGNKQDMKEKWEEEEK